MRAEERVRRRILASARTREVDVLHGPGEFLESRWPSGAAGARAGRHDDRTFAHESAGLSLFPEPERPRTSGRGQAVRPRQRRMGSGQRPGQGEMRRADRHRRHTQSDSDACGPWAAGASPRHVEAAARGVEARGADGHVRRHGRERRGGKRERRQPRAGPLLRCAGVVPAARQLLVRGAVRRGRLGGLPGPQGEGHADEELGEAEEGEGLEGPHELVVASVPQGGLAAVQGEQNAPRRQAEEPQDSDLGGEGGPRLAVEHIADGPSDPGVEEPDPDEGDDEPDGAVEVAAVGVGEPGEPAADEQQLAEVENLWAVASGEVKYEAKGRGEIRANQIEDGEGLAAYESGQYQRNYARHEEVRVEALDPANPIPPSHRARLKISDHNKF